VKEQVDVNELQSQKAIVRLSRHVDKAGVSSCDRMDTIMQCGSPEIADEKVYEYRGSVYR
jgi:hypothetical protein